MAHFSNTAALATRTLPIDVYFALRRSLLEQGTQPHTIVVTEQDVRADWCSHTDWTAFVFLVTPTTQGLMVHRAIEPAHPPVAHQAKPVSPDPSQVCAVGMVTTPTALVEIAEMLLHSAPDDQIRQNLLKGQQWLGDRSADSCSDLILSLLPALTALPVRLSTSLSSPPPSVEPALPATAAEIRQAASAQVALDQQLEWSLLLDQVITKIRTSLDLRSILSTTVEEVRQCLAADRLLIYQFQSPLFPPIDASELSKSLPIPSGAGESKKGYVTYESLSFSKDIESLIHFTEGRCFSDYAQHHEKYLTGHPVAVEDIQERYQDSPCLLNFLEKAQVRAKVIAPILVQGGLWGLLIAHNCHTPRRWQPRELIFLQRIAAHLSIAVKQAELYEKLQEQTHSLESCVIARTQDLRDALVAAQTANLAKSEFLATMSHELRTPLTCIIGMSATLLRWSFGELSPRQRSYLTTIHESGEQLLALINDILEMAKIEAGRTALEVRTFSLNNLAQKALEPFRKKARDHNINLTLDSSLLLEQDTFTGDARRIQQILDNLLSNALKFTGEGGEVNLRIRRENHVVVFQVEDTGIGIPESQIPLLFQKFQQLETSRQRQYPGTGLGLALTKQLAELHGGTVMVNSQVGVGSVFTVRLPAQRRGEETTSHRTPAEPVPAEPVVGRIVLVEDREDTASVICDLLTAADYQVIWVLEGSRVVEQVALLQPTVVILNMQLNDVDGHRIIQALRDSLMTTQVKILALSDRQHGQPAKILNWGTDATLLLPLEPEALLEQVNALVAAAVE